MDSLPKLPMLLFELKTVHCSAEFGVVVRKKIRECYEEDPSAFSKEIKELESLRSKAVKVSRDVNGCSLLKRYYCQLCMLQNRFKGLKESELEFSWIDIYKGQVVTGNLQLELDSIMYNIGALHGELGAMDVRNRAESMKVACTHFQCAAWAFEQLKENTSGYRSKDMSREIVSFVYQIMLAQAQECILEKSILDNRKASIIAKVAAQVIEYYNSALLVLLQSAANGESETLVDVVGSRLYKEWKKFIEFKISYYSAICSLYMGSVCEEQQKMGERVAWFLSAEEKLSDASKQAKGIDRSEVDDALKFLSDVIVGKLNTAKKENDFVYHESVPTSDKLTAVKGASLVKGIGFSVADKEVSGNDIFGRLVPMEAHELASVYSEKKDSIIRDVSSRIHDKNEDLASFMSSLQLDRDTLRPSSSPVVPDDLIEICAAMSVNQNALEDAKISLGKLEELCSEVEKNIKEARSLIENEEQKEKEHQEVYGKRAPSMIIMELSKELAKHEETHQKAVQSNDNLKMSLKKHSPDIHLLSTCSAKELENLLPAVSKVPVDEKNLQQIDKLLAKVDEMKQQRFSLEEQLRNTIQKDDIIKLILSHSQNEIKHVFDTELKKYDSFVSLLSQNMDAQENILSALTKENAKYVETRKAILENENFRKNRIEQLINSYEVFHQVNSSTQKGHEFYKKFDTIVARLLARVRSVTRVQEEERLQFVDAQAKKNRFNQSTTPLISSQVSSAPKLKDFLPYMNSSKSSPAQHTLPAPDVYPPNNQNIASYAVGAASVPNTFNTANFSETLPSNIHSDFQYTYYNQSHSSTTQQDKPIEQLHYSSYCYDVQPQPPASQEMYQDCRNSAAYGQQYTVNSQPYGYATNTYSQDPNYSQQNNIGTQPTQVGNNIFVTPSANTVYDSSLTTVYTSNEYMGSVANSVDSQMYSTKTQNNNFNTGYCESIPTSYHSYFAPNTCESSNSVSVNPVYSNVPSTDTSTVIDQRKLINGNSNSNNGVNPQNMVPQVNSVENGSQSVAAKTTSDPNNLLSQFDPLWS